MKNPIIPMGAITGDLSKSQIRAMLERYKKQGIMQFLIYPRDGCEVEYMSERWLEICGDIIELADSFGMDIWLYDEYNWPSGTCRGEVIRENPEFIGKSIAVRDGEIVISAGVHNGDEYYSDILNPDAVDCFIAKTHEVYYSHFAKYFGSTIKGIFTDEPSFRYTFNGTVYPYTQNLESIYFDEYGEELFEMIKSPTPEFNTKFYTLISRLFRENYVGRIADWCKNHGILLTGHLMCESEVHNSLTSSGDSIVALRRFGLPGIDEVYTFTDIDRAEWITFGIAQAAIRKSGCGGLVETLALAPTDIVPARVVQMLRLEAMFGIDHYVLAVSASDARGNLLKNGWFNPMNYMNPWFEGYSELGLSALKAATLASKQFKSEVWVRYPLSLAMRHLTDGKAAEVNRRLITLLRTLTREQYNWQLISEEDELPSEGITVEISDSDSWTPEALLETLKSKIHRSPIVLENGRLADQLLIRRYADGTFAMLDLEDSPSPRKLTIVTDSTETPILLDGRGFYVSTDPIPTEHRTLSSLSPEFTLTLDRANTLRCNLNAEKSEYVFEVSERLENIRLTVRDYAYDGEISLDGIVLPLTVSTCDTAALTPGIAELYRSTEPFTLLPGRHTVRRSKPAKSEPYLPSCFVTGKFASEFIGTIDRLYRLPEKVGCGELSGVIGQFSGKVTYEAVVDAPCEPCRLEFDSSELYTRVYANGIFLGGQLSGFRFDIPDSLLGNELMIRIEQYTSAGPMFGRCDDVCVDGDGAKWTDIRRHFPKDYERIGVDKIRFAAK